MFYFYVEFCRGYRKLIKSSNFVDFEAQKYITFDAQMAQTMAKVELEMKNGRP